MFTTTLTRLLGIAYPILQAPMAGGPATPALAAAVSNAGGLGNLGAGYLTPEQIRSAVREVRERTDRPFGVNLFVPEQGTDDAETVARMSAYLDRYREELGLAPSPAIPRAAESFAEQVQALLEVEVPIVSFTFGIPSLEVLQAFKQRGTTVIGTATTVHEAELLAAAGVDAIIAQGSEAGGHRGTFAAEAGDALIGTMALVPQMADRVTLPVIASGGIMDGRGLVASLALGASAVQMGTAFLVSRESGAHAAYKQKVLASQEDATQVTTAYSGKAARGIRTDFMRDMQSYPGAIPGYPLQNAMTRDIRQAAAKANQPEYMSLWAGQGLRLAGEGAAADLVRRTMEQAERLLGVMAGTGGAFRG